MSVMNTISLLSPGPCSGLACGRCRIKYTLGDRLTTIPDINFVTEIDCTRPSKNIVPESSCTMSEENIVLVISCANRFLQFSYARQDNSWKWAATASFHNLSNSLITNHHSTLYHLTNWRQMIMMRQTRLPLRCQWELGSFGILRSVEWPFRADVSGQPVGTIFKGQAVQDDDDDDDDVL
jgi:hypothetical protein